MREFLRRLFGSRAHSNGSRHAADPNAAPFYVQLTDGTRVEVITAARDAGQDNLPETSDQAPDEVQSAIIGEYQRRHREELERRRGELRAIGDEFDRLERELPTTRDLHSIVESAAANLDRDRRASDGLVTLLRDWARRLRDFRRFRQERAVSHEPRYPKSRLHHLAQLGIVLVAESVANAGFFAMGSDVGLLGGFVVAVVVSLVNLVLGYLAGFFCVRWRRHPEPRLKLLATAGLVLYLMVALVFNFAAARYRDAADPEQVLRHLFDVTQPMSAASAALLIVGLLASALALWKGYRADDAMPGHSDVHIPLKQAEEALQEGRAKQQATLVGHAESVPIQCRELLQRFLDLLRQLGELLACAQRCAEGYDAERHRLEGWQHLWLRKYREANGRLRTTPPPAHFALFPPLPHALDTALIEMLRQRLVEAARRLEEFKAAVHQLELGQRERVQAAHRAFEEQWAEVVQRAEARHGIAAAALEHAVPNDEEARRA